MRGCFHLAIRDPDGAIVDERRSTNVMCTAGLTQLAAALNWAMVQDQNTAMGNPLSPQSLYPIYGAVGSSDTPESSSDVRLGAELSRVVVSEASTSSSVILMFFFFGTTVDDWPIQEAGVFVSSGASVAGSAANTGLLLDHTTFSEVPKASSQTALLTVTFDF